MSVSRTTGCTGGCSTLKGEREQEQTMEARYVGEDKIVCVIAAQRAFKIEARGLEMHAKSLDLKL